ncbi:hypothetical protein PFISCL1PPCAC_13976, partial [Pristionchus fissidentatus]
HFNVQLRPLFELLQQLEGVQLAPHLCEPDINKFIDVNREAAVANDLVKMQLDREQMLRLELVSRAFGNNVSVTYRIADTITVNLNATSETAEGAARAIPTWLQSSPDEDATAAAVDDLEKAAGSQSHASTSLTLNELAAFETAEAEQREEGVSAAAAAAA